MLGDQRRAVWKPGPAQCPGFRGLSAPSELRPHRGAVPTSGDLPAPLCLTVSLSYGFINKGATHSQILVFLLKDPVMRFLGR